MCFLIAASMDAQTSQAMTFSTTRPVPRLGSAACNLTMGCRHASALWAAAAPWAAATPWAADTLWAARHPLRRCNSVGCRLQPRQLPLPHWAVAAHWARREGKPQFVPQLRPGIGIGDYFAKLLLRPRCVQETHTE